MATNNCGAYVYRHTSLCSCLVGGIVECPVHSRRFSPPPPRMSDEDIERIAQRVAELLRRRDRP